MKWKVIMKVGTLTWRMCKESCQQSLGNNETTACPQFESLLINFGKKSTTYVRFFRYTVFYLLVCAKFNDPFSDENIFYQKSIFLQKIHIFYRKSIFTQKITFFIVDWLEKVCVSMKKKLKKFNFRILFNRNVEWNLSLIVKIF